MSEIAYLKTPDIEAHSLVSGEALPAVEGHEAGDVLLDAALPALFVLQDGQWVQQAVPPNQLIRCGSFHFIHDGTQLANITPEV